MNQTATMSRTVGSKVESTQSSLQSCIETEYKEARKKGRRGRCHVMQDESKERQEEMDEADRQ